MYAKKMILSAALLGCGALHSAWAGKNDDTLRIGFTRESDTLDVYFNATREGVVMAHLIWDALLWRNPKTGQYQPGLADEWAFIDNRTLEFKLKRGVKFHNGEKFDADDVVYTMNWISNPENGVKARRFVDWIKVAEKVDSNTVRIIAKKPFPAALEMISNLLVIYPDEYHAEVGPDLFGRAPVGTGPYAVTDVDIGKKITFRANRQYFGGSKGAPAIGNIVVSNFSDKNTLLAEVLTGRIDWMWNVPADQAEKLQNNPQLQVVNESTMRIGFVVMDAVGRSGDTPFTKRKVRQAVAHAINREAIVKHLVKGRSTVIHSACFPTQIGCEQSVRKYEYNPDKARRLLEEAGYPDGFRVDLHANRDRPYVEAMLSDLQEVGIDANLVYIKWPALREKRRAGKVALQHTTWGSYSVNDVSAITSVFFSDNPDDYAHDRQVRQWLAEGDNSTDLEVRKAAYSKALRRIAEQAYWVPTWTYNVNYVFSKDLNFTPDYDEYPRFYQSYWN